MMKNLYIDFDGVLLDTIPTLYDMLDKEDIKSDDELAKSEFFSKVDWEGLIKTTDEINESLTDLKKLCSSKKFNVHILTHINSINEAIAKINFLDGITNDLTIIPVPKRISKTKMTQTKNAILVDDFSGNLNDWEENGGIGVKFTKEKENTKFINITKLDELINIF